MSEKNTLAGLISKVFASGPMKWWKIVNWYQIAPRNVTHFVTANDPIVKVNATMDITRFSIITAIGFKLGLIIFSENLESDKKLSFLLF